MFHITNTHKEGVSIKVIGVQYRLKGTKVWHSENVFDHVLLANGGSWTTDRQTLEAAVKGSKLDLRAEFKADTGKGYGASKFSAITDSKQVCEDGVNYPIKIGPQ